MAVTREAIVICLDVGPHMRIRDDEGNATALEQAIECVNWILQRKIFTEAKDEFAIVLFGTNETENALANDDSEDYSNVCVTRELQKPDWDLVKYIQNEVPPPGTPVSADFLDAIVVSLDLLVTSTEGKKYAGKQLVLFSNLGSPFGDDQIDGVVDALKNGGIELTLFGPRLYLLDDEGARNDDHQRAQNGAGNLKKTSQQELGERFMTRILNRVNGQAYSLTQGLSLLSKFTTRTVRPTPWKCNLELGTKIKIPICMYVKTKKAKNKQSWKWTNAQDPNADITMQRTYHKKDEDDDDQDETQATKPKYPQRDEDGAGGGDEEETEPTSHAAPMGKELDKEDIIKAFNYGNTVVPLDKVDLEAMKYKNTEKCLKVLSFIDINQAKRQYFIGDGNYMAFSESADEEGSTAFSALWQAMKQEHRAALVRYAYSARSAPKTGVLIPTIEGDNEIGCFMFVAFPFAEDCRTYEFPTLDEDKVEPSDEQLKIMDDLVTSMDLTNALVDENGRRCEAYDPAAVVDPALQNTFANMAHRALYEKQPLPPVSKKLVASISPIDERMQLTKPVFERIRLSFDLKKKEERKEKRTAQGIYKTGEAAAGGPASKVARNQDDQDRETAVSVKISSVRPVEDYTEFVDKDETSFQEASEKLGTIILQFIFDAVGSQFYDKAIDCIEIYRKKSIQVSKPGVYNNFARQLKRRLIDGAKKDFLTKMANARLGLISDKECAASYVSDLEADIFFDEEEQKPSTEELPPVTSEPNLLDELE